MNEYDCVKGNTYTMRGVTFGVALHFQGFKLNLALLKSE
jgi:hypothetical protein